MGKKNEFGTHLLHRRQDRPATEAKRRYCRRRLRHQCRDWRCGSTRLVRKAFRSHSPSSSDDYDLASKHRHKGRLPEARTCLRVHSFHNTCRRDLCVSNWTHVKRYNTSVCLEKSSRRYFAVRRSNQHLGLRSFSHTLSRIVQK